ncbi:MAG: hypothetical protein ABJO86_00815 [Lentilitoribacter sp.]
MSNNAKIVELPSLEQMSDFDPNDPFDATAEKFRVMLIHTFLESGEIITYEDINPAIYGMLVGIASIACSCSKPDGHLHLTKAMIAYLPYAVNAVREMQDLPPLPQDN